MQQRKVWRRIRRFSWFLGKAGGTVQVRSVQYFFASLFTFELLHLLLLQVFFLARCVHIISLLIAANKSRSAFDFQKLPQSPR